ncbi:MAG: creatininase family protein [Ahrensia sp.]|nr:creatininase family protein [Ahrensia sp.]
MTRRLHWADYRTAEFDEIDPMKTVAVLPTAAIEQHGPHLPVGVDAMIAQGMLDTVEERIGNDIDMRILPVQAVGKSNEHLFAKGTLTIPVNLAIDLWVEIGLSVARAGVKKLVIANSHGGNLDIISIVSRELRVRESMLVAKCQWGAFGHPAGMYSTDELRYGIHGGDVETSLMLHFRPELVDMSKAQTFHSSAQDVADEEVLMPTGPISYGWIATDLGPDGVAGDASAATAEKGAQTARHQADGFVSLLHEMIAKPLPG